MEISNEEFQNIVKKLSEKKFNQLKEYAENLLNDESDQFEDGIKYIFENYNDTLKNLQQR